MNNPRPTNRTLRGRGTGNNPDSRYMDTSREGVDDGWERDPDGERRTEILVDKCRSIISYNSSPDVPFDRSINPYKGCEHGCVYCFARPTHAYLDLSPGLDFESKIYCKPKAAPLLERELAKPGYQPAPLALGVNTDAYQPVERKLKITRSVLEVLLRYQHPVAIVTKSSLVERDIDLLAPMAQQGLVHVMISVTGLDRELGRVMEPRAAAPERRLQTIRALAAAEIPTGVLFAPVIPALNDDQIETVLNACADAGALTASYVMLRLPQEVSLLFEDWLNEHYPLKAKHIMNLVRSMRGGKVYDAKFGERMTGTGEIARLIQRRFQLACQAAGLMREMPELERGLFGIPQRSGDQLGLF